MGGRVLSVSTQMRQHHVTPKMIAATPEIVRYPVLYVSSMHSESHVRTSERASERSRVRSRVRASEQPRANQTDPMLPAAHCHSADAILVSFIPIALQPAIPNRPWFGFHCNVDRRTHTDRFFCTRRPRFADHFLQNLIKHGWMSITCVEDAVKSFKSIRWHKLLLKSSLYPSHEALAFLSKTPNLSPGASGFSASRVLRRHSRLSQRHLASPHSL